MASTNKTPNYELSQFVEADRPAWLTDYNGDMRTLDTALKAVSDVASGASGSISELADRMSTAEGNITTNANDIDALEARADSLEAQTQNITGAIGNINTEQIAQNAGIEAATQLAYNIARPYDAASTYEVGDYVIFKNTLYKCVTAVPVGEAFVPAKWLAIKVMDELGIIETYYSDTDTGEAPISDDIVTVVAGDGASGVTINRVRAWVLNSGGFRMLKISIKMIVTPKSNTNLQNITLSLTPGAVLRSLNYQEITQHKSITWGALAYPKDSNTAWIGAGFTLARANAYLSLVQVSTPSQGTYDGNVWANLYIIW